MRSLMVTLGVSAIIGICSALAIAAGHRTTAPSGVILAQPGSSASVPCNTQLRYDDGTDDTPNGAPTLGWHSGTDYQHLGVLFTSPTGQNHRVQSASWFSEFWVIPGLVDVTALEANNSGNAVTVTVDVTDGGTWEVEFPDPICIPDGADYFIMLCPHPGVWGVLSDDRAAPDRRSYGSRTGCMPAFTWPPELDFMLWSCVAPCVPTQARLATWGGLKIRYR